MSQYQDRIDLITIYIEEAHATDEWPIGSSIQYLQPRCDADRISIVKDFIRDTCYELPIAVDPVSDGNPFSRMYHPWPIRFYIVDRMNRFVYIAEPSKCSFSMSELVGELDRSIDVPL